MPTVRLLAVTVALIAACTSTAQRLSVDRDVSFAAHRIHAGLMIDAMRGGEPALVRPATWPRLPGEATFVLSDGTALWVGGPGSVTVRRTRAPDSPIVGAVAPSWDDNAIRIAIEPAGRPRYETDVFTREDIGGGTSALSRLAPLTIDVRGTYRATLRDADARPVGWIRVAVGLHQAAPEIYTAVLPPEPRVRRVRGHGTQMIRCMRSQAWPRFAGRQGFG